MNDTLLTWLVYVIVAALATWALTMVTLLGRAIAVRLLRWLLDRIERNTSP